MAVYPLRSFSVSQNITHKTNDPRPVDFDNIREWRHVQRVTWPAGSGGGERMALRDSRHHYEQVGRHRGTSLPLATLDFAPLIRSPGNHSRNKWPPYRCVCRRLTAAERDCYKPAPPTELNCRRSAHAVAIDVCSCEDIRFYDNAQWDTIWASREDGEDTIYCWTTSAVYFDYLFDLLAYFE